jgi:hypothetical protein
MHERYWSLKAAYFIIRICSDDLIYLERESDGKGVRGYRTESSVIEFPFPAHPPRK